MVWVDHADVFDFDVFLNWVCLPKTYAGFGSECNRAVDRYYLYGLLDHATFTFSRKITCFRIRSRKVNDCMFPGEAAFLEGSAASMSANGASVHETMVVLKHHESADVGMYPFIEAHDGICLVERLRT